MKVGQGTYLEDDIDTPDERQERLPLGRLLRYAAVGVGIAAALGGATATLTGPAYHAEVPEAVTDTIVVVDGYEVQLPADYAELPEWYADGDVKGAREDVQKVRGDILFEVRAQVPALLAGEITMDEAYELTVDSYIEHHKDEEGMEGAVQAVEEKRDEPDLRDYVVSELEFNSYLFDAYSHVTGVIGAPPQEFLDDVDVQAGVLAECGDMTEYARLSEEKAANAQVLVNRIVREVGFPFSGFIRRPLTDVLVTEPLEMEQEVILLVEEQVPDEQA